MRASAAAGAAAVVLALASGAGRAACELSGLAPDPLWTGEAGDWYRAAPPGAVQFGAGNLTHGTAGLRAAYPRGSYDPAAVRTSGAPLGGAQFRTPFARLGLAADGEIGIRYRVTLDANFDFVRGGKLPGLYGGRANSGGQVPDGTDGYSLRFVWQAGGSGALSAYLPGSAKWGSVFGLGQWRFVPGRTVELALYVRLNTPGRADGLVAAWADDALVAYAPDLVLRSVPTLGLDGFFFSTFFGGGTPDWATPVDTATHFGRMDVFRLDRAALARCAGGLTALQIRHEMK
jgi:hypothetical protein